MMKKENFTKQPMRMCVEKMSKYEQDKIENIKNNSDTNLRNKHIQAAVLKSNIWSIDDEITIEFLQYKTQPEWTPIETLHSLSDNNQIDPLENEVRLLSPSEAVKKIVTERIIPIVGIKIRFVKPNEKGIVRVSFDIDGGAWSLVGTDHKKELIEPTLNLGWLDVGTVIHEFCHMLGLIHEHQNPDDNEIQWNVKKVYDWALLTQGWDEATTYDNIIKRYSIDEINGTSYDKNSIMLYFYPNDITLNNKGTHQNFILSPTDVMFLSKTYPGGVLSPSVFYKNTYNVNITNDKTNTGYSSFSIIIIIIIIIIFVFSFLYFYLKKKNLISQDIK